MIVWSTPSKLERYKPVTRHDEEFVVGPMGNGSFECGGGLWGSQIRAIVLCQPDVVSMFVDDFSEEVEVNPDSEVNSSSESESEESN